MHFWKSVRDLWPLLLVVAVAAAMQSGCASAYHDYPCGQVPYRYCAEPPLPYRTYQACPTPVAAGLQQQADSPELYNGQPAR